jgi:hypothetical protein
VRQVLLHAIYVMLATLGRLVQHARRARTKIRPVQQHARHVLLDILASLAQQYHVMRVSLGHSLVALVQPLARGVNLGTTPLSQVQHLAWYVREEVSLLLPGQLHARVVQRVSTAQQVPQHALAARPANLASRGHLAVSCVPQVTMESQSAMGC